MVIHPLFATGCRPDGRMACHSNLAPYVRGLPLGGRWLFWFRALILLGLLAPWSLPAAELPLEIIELRHRQAEDLLPVLRTMVAPGGRVSGMQHKLFIRSTADNLAQLRAALAELDQPAVRLLISIRQSAAQIEHRRGADVHGRIGNERISIESPPAGAGMRNSGVELQIGGGYRQHNMQAVQQVQTIEGGQAYIHTGVSVPVPLRRRWLSADGVVLSDTVIWRDLGTGFNAVPRILGDRVRIEISPYDEEPLSVPGAAAVRRLSTTVEGRLGEWIALGASALDGADTEAAITSREAAEASRSNALWLKVERLD
ncbi:secretin N-terminal domain-containing protein [Pseudothauera hydrothermalis]|uniref:secretin N-terminal domain-containing protein n=1 Tax=Pseudothauera hydrothermalis TaxID=2184083 RepID=UPI000E08E92C|nr:secretin N-terminal domain-containing protein [Pseudothauera hydrothermalis]